MSQCSCIICHKEYSNKGIHSHYNINHTIEGKEKHKNNCTIGAIVKNKKYPNNYENDYIINPSYCQQCNIPLSYKQRNNKFCSHACSAIFTNKERTENGYIITEEHKQKISLKLKGISHNYKYTSKNKLRPEYTKVSFCVICNKYFIGNRKTCSDNCLSIRYSNIGKDNASKTIKRSKQEIELYNLCKNHFTNVTHNTQFFNGWDADILIHDINLAILWNGPWHYQEMDGLQHSLKQVQNRDNIKINEIQKLGWNYIIFEDRYYTPNSAFQSIILSNF